MRVAISLFHIFTFSLFIGVFWFVVLIIKCSLRNKLENSKGIAKLSVFAKVLESLVTSFLTSWLAWFDLKQSARFFDLVVLLLLI